MSTITRCLVVLGTAALLLASGASTLCAQAPGASPPGHGHSPAAGARAEAPSDEQVLAFFAGLEPHLPALRLIAVQERGQFKTLDTLARLQIGTIHGSRTLSALAVPNPELRRSDPLLLRLDMALRPTRWIDARIIRVDKPLFRRELLAQLGEQIVHSRAKQLEEGYITPDFIESGAMRAALGRLSTNIILYEKPVRELQEAYHTSLPGMILDLTGIVPPPVGDERASWLSIRQAMQLAEQTARGDAGALANAPEKYPAQLADVAHAWRMLHQSWGLDADRAGQAIQTLARTLADMRADMYPTLQQRRTELAYMHAGKFTWVWLVYFAAAAALLLGVVRQWPTVQLAGAAAFVMAFLLHSLGIGLRWIVSGRIPIASQFESMLAAAWFTGLVAMFGLSIPALAKRVVRAESRWQLAAVLLMVSLTVGGFAAHARGEVFIAGIPTMEEAAAGVAAMLMTLALGSLVALGLIPRRDDRPAALPGGDAPVQPYARSDSPLPAALAFAGGSAAAVSPFEPVVRGGGSPGAVSGGQAERVARTRAGLSTPAILLMIGASVAGMLALAFGHFLPLSIRTEIRTIAPILNDTLLYIHVNTIILSYGLITIAAIVGLIYLASHARAVARARRAGAPRALLEPAWRDALDGTAMSMIHLSFITLWVGIALGAMWADYSWGRPWGWDPKEVFALNTWLLLLILVHVRFRLSVDGRCLATAWLCVASWLMMLFNYWWVNFKLPGLHSYA